MTMETGQLWRQYIIAAIANMAITSIGYCMGWTSPINQKLENITTSPLDHVITSDEQAWIGSLVNIGAICSPFLGGYAASNIGRKWTLFSVSIPLFVGWILVSIATNVIMIYTARVFWGLAVGITFTVLPIYLTEIATDNRRGALGSMMVVFITIGFLMVYSIGPYVSYAIVSYVGIACTTVFTVLFYFMPESPMYHLSKGNVEDAAKCLAIIRGKSRKAIQADVDKMADEVRVCMAKKATIGDVFRGGNFKAFYISCSLLFFQQFCGINAVLFNMNTIFKAAGTTIDPSISTIIVGAVQVVAACFTPFLVERFGRRALLLVSTCGTAVSLGILGMYFTLAENESPMAKSMGICPILSLGMFIVMYCWGIGPLPGYLAAELFPIEVKAVATPIATAFCWTLSFLITRYFSLISELAGMGSTFLVFGVFCVAAFFFTLFLVPETKGKSFQEIQEMLAGKDTDTEKV